MRHLFESLSLTLSCVRHRLVLCYQLCQERVLVVAGNRCNHGVLLVEQKEFNEVLHRLEGTVPISPEGILPKLLENRLALAKVAEVLQQLCNAKRKIGLYSAFSEAFFMLSPHPLDQTLEDLVRSRVLSEGLKLLQVEMT